MVINKAATTSYNLGLEIMDLIENIAINNSKVSEKQLKLEKYWIAWLLFMSFKLCEKLNQIMYIEEEPF